MNQPHPNTPTSAASGAPPKANPVNVKKLLLSKWTAVQPIDKCKHFLVIKVIAPEELALNVQWVELEAVHSSSVRRVHWQELRDVEVWRVGWV